VATRSAAACPVAGPHRTLLVTRALRAVLPFALALCAALAALSAARGGAQDAPIPPPPGGSGAPGADAASYDDDAAFRRAMDAFAAGRYAEAAAGFDLVAARTADAGRRATATSLAAEARSRASAPPSADTPPPPPGYGGSAPPAAEDTERPPPPPPSSSADPGQGPRAALLTATTIFGLAQWGWGTPIALGLEGDGRASVGTYLLVSAASFFGPFLLTMSDPPTWGTAALAIHGGLNGFWHGALLYGAIAATTDDYSGRALLATMLVASLLETAGGYVLASQTDMDAGKAHAIHTGALLGAGTLAGLSFVLAGEDIEDAAVPLWLGVAGIVGGGIGGAVLADHLQLTWGDVHAIEVAATVGAYLGAVVAIDAELAGNVRAFSALATLGGVGGAVLGGLLVSGKDLHAWQGLVLHAATALAGSAGAGAAFVLGADDARVIATVGLLTAAAGFGLSLLAFDLPDEVPGGREADATLHPIVRSLAVAPWIDIERGSKGLALSGRF
jgi:hypothetical protein